MYSPSFYSPITYNIAFYFRFLGNKLASYGGNLTYTIRDKSRSGGLPRNNLPDIVIHSVSILELFIPNSKFNKLFFFSLEQQNYAISLKKRL